jgi:hypothetical protein
MSSTRAASAAAVSNLVYLKNIILFTMNVTLINIPDER